MKNNRTVIYSKLIKTQMLLDNRELAKHVPATRRLTRSRLLKMLELYGMVYVKPDRGSLGIGVMRVARYGGKYTYQSGEKSFAFPAFQEMFQSIKNRIGRKRYLVQKGIYLLRYKGRPFDFRVMIQKNGSRKWESTGTVGRVAHPQKAVTNGSQGGTIFPASELIKPFAGHKKTVRLLKKMDCLALLTAAQFSRGYPAMNELGLDIAVDRDLNPWILEVNTRPDPCPFTKIKNKDAINKIIAYAKAYGRRYYLTCSKARRGPNHIG